MDIARAAEIEPGDQFMVEVVGGALIYRRVELSGPADPITTTTGGPRGYFVGEGKDRYFQLYPWGGDHPGRNPSAPGD